MHLWVRKMAAVALLDTKLHDGLDVFVEPEREESRWGAFGILGNGLSNDVAVVGQHLWTLGMEQGHLTHLGAELGHLTC
jgi:hypothetical protein